MPVSNEICLFLHIPKAAGTTLQSVLSRNFPVQSSWIMDSSRPETALDRFYRLPESIKKKYRVIRGHIPFGVHKFLTSDFTYVTILRHPVDRLVSHYYYVKQCGPAHYLYEQLRKNRYSLVEYVQSGISCELDNGQVRLLTDTESSVPVGALTRLHLEQAKENLVRYFGAVGTVDRFDEFLILLKKRLSISHIDYDRENVTRVRPRLLDLPQSHRNEILKHNRLDLELYEFADQLMDSQIRA